jgi:hypothetical protein
MKHALGHAAIIAILAAAALLISVALSHAQIPQTPTIDDSECDYDRSDQSKEARECRGAVIEANIKAAIPKWEVDHRRCLIRVEVKHVPIQYARIWTNDDDNGFELIIDVTELRSMRKTVRELQKLRNGGLC